MKYFYFPALKTRSSELKENYQEQNIIKQACKELNLTY